MTVLSNLQTHKSHSDPSCEYEVLPNTKFGAAKDDGKSDIKVRPPLVHYLLRNFLGRPRCTLFMIKEPRNEHAIVVG